MVHLLLSNLGFVFGCVAGVAAFVLLLAVVERASARFVAHRLGWRAVLATAWIGVPVHELSHLGAAAIFRHRIISWSLFSPDPESGTLGYVRHAHSNRNLWQMVGYFAIGIAPPVVGLLLVTLVLVWMTSVGDVVNLLGFTDMPAQVTGIDEVTLAGLLSLGEQWLVFVARVWQRRTWWLPLQLYLVVCIACHIAPSRSDLRCAGRGFFAMLIVLTIVAGISAVFRWSLVAILGVLPVVFALVLVAVAFQLAYVACVGALSRLGRASSR